MNNVAAHLLFESINKIDMSTWRMIMKKEKTKEWVILTNPRHQKDTKKYDSFFFQFIWQLKWKDKLLEKSCFLK